MRGARKSHLDDLDEVFGQSAAPSLDAEAPSGLAPSRQPGSVTTIDTFMQRSKEDSVERQRLEALIRNGETIVSLDPNLFDPSPVRDRIEDDLEDLVASIRASGQHVPVLARPHPDDSARYQVAYGNRRVMACRSLGITVKAVVRPLSDDEMVISQGQENTARQDLSFIERAQFVRKLRERKFLTPVIAAATSIDPTTMSKMETILENVPDRLIEAIGRAPKVGRPRWAKLAQVLTRPEKVRAAIAAAAEAAGRGRGSDARFDAALAAVAEARAEDAVEVRAETGRVIATVRHSAKGSGMIVHEEGFLSHLLDRLPALYQQYLDGLSQPMPSPGGRGESGNAA